MVIFVSNSIGSDSTSSTEGSFANPYKTIVKALSRMRNSSPDWLLFAKGETWTSQTFGSVFLQGLSPSAKMVFGSYDKAATISAPSHPPEVNPATGGARPIIKTPNGDPAAINFIFAKFAIVGLDFYASWRDPASPDFVPNPAASEGIAAGGAGGTPSDILIEDCRVRFFTQNIEMVGGAPSYGSNVTIRRNIIIDAWDSTGAVSVGLGATNLTPNFIIEDNNLIEIK